MLRRLDCVLAPTKEKVLKRHKELEAKGLENMDGQLRRAAGHSFHNISRFDFPKLLDEPKNIVKNLRAHPDHSGTPGLPGSPHASPRPAPRYSCRRASTGSSRAVLPAGHRSRTFTRQKLVSGPLRRAGRRTA